jgi:hypothetical protein
MPGGRKLDRVRRAQRLRQLERFLLLGLTHEEMAEKLGVSTMTVLRDLQPLRGRDFKPAAFRDEPDVVPLKHLTL